MINFDKLANAMGELDEDIVQKIRELAENDERSFSQYINMVLKNHIKRQEISDQ